MAAPAYTRAQVDHCAFTAWYDRLAHVSIKSEVIPLPPAFVSLLLADGVKLALPPKKIQELHENDGPDASQDADAERSVREGVERALRRFDGQVFPKLNWSCPRDASWMLGGSLKCSSYEDVFLLLKASDFIVHDLTQPYAGCSDVNVHTNVHTDTNVHTNVHTNVQHLVLKKWCNFFDSMHFRAFIVARRLVGISQRHCDEFYEFLLAEQDALCDAIYRFFYEHLRPRDAFPDEDIIVDVYVDKQRRVFLVDVNVFGGVTDPLLFSWEELLEMRDEIHRRRALRRGTDLSIADEEDEAEEEDQEDQTVDFRIVESAQGIRPHPLSAYRTPTDFVDHLATAGGFDAFIDQVRRDNAAGASDSDEGVDAGVDAGVDDDDDDDDVKWGSDNDDYD